MIKSRAAVAFEAKKPLEIVEVDVAMPKAGEVLLRVVARGFLASKATAARDLIMVILQ